MRALALTFVACLAGCQCQRPPLVSADGDLSAHALRVDFGGVWLQSTGRRTLALSNTGRAPMAVALTTTPPFGAPTSLTLEGGERREIELTFAPAALGAATALLTVQGDDAQLTLALDGLGVAPPPCDPEVCRVGRLDEASSSCVQEPRPDGEVCSDRCVTGACSSGACVGTLERCEDDDPCTIDACAPGEGCVHAPKVCTPAGPCSVGSCDRAQGCVQTPAPDGVACGEADCATAHVCIAGQCVSRAVPDGSPCGSESLCQPRGVCTAQVCLQPAPSPLARVFTYVSPQRLHGLVADAQGNYFTAECRNAGTFRAQCELVSFAPTGAERWRQPFPHVSATGMGALRDALMVAGDVVVSTIGPSWVDAFDAATGASRWSVDTAASGIFGPPAPAWVRIVSAAYDGAGELILTLESQTGGAIGSTRVVGLATATGALRHSLALPAQGFSVVVDRAAGIYLGHLSGLPTLLDTVTALDPSWAVRWQRTTPVVGGRITTLRATHQGRLLLTHPQATQLWTTAGATVSTALPTSSGDPLVAWSDAALFTTDQHCPSASCQSFDQFRFEVVSVASQTLAVTRAPLPDLYWYAGLWLTQRGSVLLSLGPKTSAAELREVEARGATRMACPLGLAPGRSPRSGPLLTVGQYAAVTAIDVDGYQPQLEVWALPGYSPAPTGWLSSRGGPSLDARAR